MGRMESAGSSLAEGITAAITHSADSRGVYWTEGRTLAVMQLAGSRQ